MFLIVAGHCIPYIPLFSNGSFSSYILTTAIFNGSSIFVLISGFFFQHVFYEKFNYIDFLNKKIRNVVFPYLFMSLVIVVFFRLGHEDVRMGGYFNPQGDGLFNEYIIPLLKYLLLGGATTTYWFIPFISLIFCFSPLHIKFADLNTTISVITLLITLFLSMIILRPEHNINVLQSFIYYHFFYLFGIFFAKKRQVISLLIVKRYYWLLACFFTFNTLLAYWQSIIDINADANSLIAINRLIVPLKLIEFCVLYGLFEKFKSLNVKPLSWFADMSFAVYFIHPVVISAFKEHWVRLDFFMPWSVFFLACFFVIASCMAIAFILKMMFGDRTRLFIGW